MDYQDPRRKLESDADKAIRVHLKKVFEMFDADPALTEVNINGPDQTFVKRAGRREPVPGLKFVELQLTAAVNSIGASMGLDVVPETPTSVVNGKLPGYRFSAILYPLAACGTSISIRRHSLHVRTMDQYVNDGTIDEATALLLQEKVRNSETILVSGGTDTGKTTFLNMLGREIPVDERVGTIEDTRELSILTPNWLPLEYNKQKGVTAALCVETFMRQSPDRILIGEMRDEVAAAFLEAANTGHDGNMATVHANSSTKALTRLETLVMRAGQGWPLEAIRQQIGTTVGTVIHLGHDGDRRVVKEISEVKGYDFQNGVYQFKTIFDREQMKRAA